MALVKAGKKKVVFYGETIIDHSGATVDASTLDNNVTAWDAKGNLIRGESTKDVDSSAGNLTPSMVVSGGIGFSQGSRVDGNIPNKDGVTLEISDVNDELSIPYGLHDGTGKAKLSAAAKASVDADVILEGNTILGVAGKAKMAECKAQAKSATPSTSQQVIRPDAGYTHLTTVTVAAVPYVESTDTDGSKVITIG